MKKDHPFTGGWFAVVSVLIFLWLLLNHPPSNILGGLLWLFVLVFTGLTPIYWLILSLYRYTCQEVRAYRERRRGLLLTWKPDPRGEGLWRAELNGVAYVIMDGSGVAWIKRGYSLELLGIGQCQSNARDMCERHARDPK